jgi:hypothetical protein
MKIHNLLAMSRKSITTENMMKVKTSELTGTALDWAVAKCEGFKYELYEHNRKKWENGLYRPQHWQPSTDWAQGGPIIEREEISVEPLYTAGGLDCWQAYGHNLRYDDQGNYIQGSDNRQYGPTPLIAAMRCYCCAKLGDEIEIPQELQQCQL